MALAPWANCLATSVIEHSPIDTAPVTTNITATFDQPMDPETITAGSFSVAKKVGIKAVATGMWHNVALKNDGTVVAWGWDSYGQTKVPKGLSNVKKIAAGTDHTIALKNDGTLVSWGYNGSYNDNSNVIPAGLSNVKDIAIGEYHNLALKNDGTVVAWGWDSYGQTNVPAGLSDVKAIAAGIHHSVALKEDGTVVAWGWDSYGQTNVPAGLSDVKAIAAGMYFTAVLKNDGTVTAWGGNQYGQNNIPVGLSDVKTITGGYGFIVALKNDGTVVAWGAESDNQINIPNGLSDIQAVVAKSWHTIALKNDGTIVSWGSNNSGQTNIPVNIYESTVSGTVTYDSNNRKATFSSSNSLELGAEYIVRINGARSEAGEPIANEFNWSFKTEAASNPIDGLIGFWQGEKNTKDTLEANDGISGDNLSYAEGVSGQAFKFNEIANSSVSIPDSVSLHPANFTTSAWVYWDDINTNKVQFIFGKQLKNFELHTGGDSGINGLRFIPAGHPDTTVDAPNILQAGWNYITVSYDGSTARIFRNGVLAKERTGIIGGANLTLDTAPLVIGKRANGNFPFKGSLDEIKFFDRALSAQEVSSLFAAY